jgi:hypothetical protein
MDATTGVDGRDLLFQYFCSVSDAAGCWHTSDENFDATSFEDFSDASPVSDLHWGNRWPDGEKVEPEEAMAEHDGVLG